MCAVKIALITPAPPRSLNGNRTTAVRWTRFLRAAGHRVSLATEWDGRPADLMLALHARRSFASMRAFRDAYPARALVLALTGTDIYRDIHDNADAALALEWATRLIVLQDQAPRELAAHLWPKVDVVYQSARALAAPTPYRTYFEISLLAHLRAEKDPLCGAHAMQFLPADSRVRLRHYGTVLDEALASEARALMLEQPRYRWLGPLPHAAARRRLARSHALLLSSRMEGGANVASEAIAQGVVILASKIPGNVGMCGADYEGYYILSDARALADLITRVEREPRFFARLREQIVARQPLVTVAAERRALLRAIESAHAATVSTDSVDNSVSS